MKLSIRYLTNFTYDAEVTESHNALRACPLRSDTQQLIEYTVRVDPEARVYSYTDYWGTRVDSFSVVGSHTRLTVIADSVVETSTPASPTDGGPWPTGPRSDVDYEYLTPSPHVEWDNMVVEFAKGAVAGATGLVEAATAIQHAIGEFLSYESGTTEVGTSVAEIIEHRSGVCQDYAHLALAAYRAIGIPARYVSGYLYAQDSSDGSLSDDADEIDVMTHAWVDVAIPGYGWWGLDPTNQLEVGERHVKIGHGRDYEDVTPLRGVYHGDAESGGLEAAVKMSRSGLSTHRLTPRPVYSRRRESAQQQQQQ